MIHGEIVMEDRRAESGYILVTVAILLIVLLGFTALAVDVGMLYASRTQSQRAADAGALAGAFSFVLNPDVSDQPARAILDAKKVATANTAMGTTITDAQVNVTVEIPQRRVSVNIQRDEPTFFAKVLSSSTVNVGVTAVAEAAANATSASCVKPWFIPNTIMSSKAPCEACASSPPEVMAAGGVPTAYAQGKFGQPMTVKPQQGSGGGSIAPGQYYIVQVTGPGADPYRDAISTCLPALYSCFDSYPVEPGAKVGPTKQGVEDLVGKPAGYQYVDLNEYRRVSDSTIHDTAPGLVIAPIVDLCAVTGFCPGNDFPGGSGTTLTVKGFALIFLDGMQGNDVQAHLINVYSCSGVPPVGGDPTGSAAFSIPIRLVHK
jgi:Flp pilus assembly protein TadG